MVRLISNAASGGVLVPVELRHRSNGHGVFTLKAGAEPITRYQLAVGKRPVGAARGEIGVNDKVVAVLVVEDDQLIQAFAQEALSDGGFEAVVTTSGEEAIRLLQENKSHYRAVVSDINLSGKLTGWDVAVLPEKSIPQHPSSI